MSKKRSISAEGFVKLTIQGQEFTLSQSEAEELRSQLGNALNKGPEITLPQFREIPVPVPMPTCNYSGISVCASSMSNDIPIIRVEMEGLKQQMAHAFMGQQLQLDEQFKKALDLALDPDRIQEQLNELAAQEIAAALSSTVENYFSFGKGRGVLKERVEEELSRMFP